MTDTAALIESLRKAAKIKTAQWEDTVEWQAAEALSRLAAPPPEEIAELINMAYAHSGDCEGARSEAFLKLATALRSQAQAHENTAAQYHARIHYSDGLEQRIRELEAELYKSRERWTVLQHHAETMENEVRGLEAERDKLAKQVRLGNEAIESLRQESGNRCREAIAERDAIRAKTIEECAQIAYKDSATIIAQRICERIRALAHKDEAKTH